MSLFDGELEVRLVICRSINELPVTIIVIGGEELSESGNEFEITGSKVARPGEHTVVRAAHFSGIICTPSVGGGVAYEVERCGYGFVRSHREVAFGHLFAVDAVNCSREAGVESDGLARLCAEFRTDEVVELLDGGIPVVHLLLGVLYDGGICEACAGFGKFKGVAYTRSGAEVGTCGPGK